MSQSPYNDLLELIQTIPRWSDCDLRSRAEFYGQSTGTSDEANLFSMVYSRMARIQANELLKVDDVHLALLASSYEGSMSPTDVAALVAAHSSGRAPLNSLCVRDGLGLRVLEMAVPIADQPGDPKRVGDKQALMASMAFGMEATASGGDLIGLGSIAPGSRQSALAVLCALHGEDPLGDMAGFLEKGEAVAVSKLVNAMPEKNAGPLDWLAFAGGREMAGMMGAILAGSSQSVPILLEGWSALAAATVLVRIAPDDNKQDILGHVIAASSSCALETSFQEAIGLSPVLRETGNLPAGSGLVLATGVIKQAATLVG